MDKIVCWSINTGGTKRLTDRLTAVFDRLATSGASVIGLSEAGQVVQPAIREFAHFERLHLLCRTWPQRPQGCLAPGRRFPHDVGSLRERRSLLGRQGRRPVSRGGHRRAACETGLRRFGLQLLPPRGGLGRLSCRGRAPAGQRRCHRRWRLELFAHM